MELAESGDLSAQRSPLHGATARTARYLTTYPKYAPLTTSRCARRAAMNTLDDLTISRRQALLPGYRKHADGVGPDSGGSVGFQ
jgi:hypothetical protein